MESTLSLLTFIGVFSLLALIVLLLWILKKFMDASVEGYKSISEKLDHLISLHQPTNPALQQIEAAINTIIAAKNALKKLETQ